MPFTVGNPDNEGVEGYDDVAVGGWDAVVLGPGIRLGWENQGCCGAWAPPGRGGPLPGPTDVLLGGPDAELLLGAA